MISKYGQNCDVAAAAGSKPLTYSQHHAIVQLRARARINQKQQRQCELGIVASQFDLEQKDAINCGVTRSTRREEDYRTGVAKYVTHRTRRAE